MRASGPERRPQAAGPASLSVPKRVVLRGRGRQRSIHSIQIDESMQNRQVSGSSAYWFRCIPNRLGCIATFLISKPDPRHSLLLRATVGATEPWVGGRGGAASAGSAASVWHRQLHVSSNTLRVNTRTSNSAHSSKLTTARRFGRADGEQEQAA